MRVRNADGRTDVSDVLDITGQLLRAKGSSCDPVLEKDGTKGTFVIELVVALGSGVAASVIYDVLKIAISRARQSKKLSDSAIIEIDGKKYTIAEIEKK